MSVCVCACVQFILEETQLFLLYPLYAHQRASSCSRKKNSIAIFGWKNVMQINSESDVCDNGKFIM